MNNIFFDGHDELYHHTKFGENRTTRGGCRCENMVFVCLFFVTLRGRRAVRSRGAHSSNKHCVAVYRPIPTGFSDCFFSQGIAVSGALHSPQFCWMAPQVSRSCGQKLRKIQKSAEKFVRTTSYR